MKCTLAEYKAGEIMDSDEKDAEKVAEEFIKRLEAFIDIKINGTAPDFARAELKEFAFGLFVSINEELL